MTGKSTTSGKPGIVPVIQSLFFILVFLALLFVCGNLRQFLPAKLSWLAYGVLGSLAAFLSVWIFLRFDKRSFASIGLVWERRTLRRFAYGCVIGSVIVVFLIICLLLFSSLTIRYNPEFLQIRSIAAYLPIFPLVLMEEIAFRSYPQVKLERAYHVWTSQVVIAIAFGVYHVLNGWGWYGAFAGPFVWAFVFGLAAIWSRGIAVPTGIHFALNVVQTAAGFKGNKASVWILDYPAGTSQITMNRTDKLGLALQVFVLIGALVFTAWYVRAMKRKA